MEYVVGVFFLLARSHPPYGDYGLSRVFRSQVFFLVPALEFPDLERLAVGIRILLWVPSECSELLGNPWRDIRAGLSLGCVCVCVDD